MVLEQRPGQLEDMVWQYGEMLQGVLDKELAMVKERAQEKEKEKAKVEKLIPEKELGRGIRQAGQWSERGVRLRKALREEVQGTCTCAIKVTASGQ